MFGLPWKIFSADEIQALIETAAKSGFACYDSPPDLTCEEGVVRDGPNSYMFAAMAFCQPPRVTSHRMLRRRTRTAPAGNRVRVVSNVPA